MSGSRVRTGAGWDTPAMAFSVSAPLRLSGYFTSGFLESRLKAFLAPGAASMGAGWKFPRPVSHDIRRRLMLSVSASGAPRGPELSNKSGGWSNITN
jgi:hypothetical protein